MAIACNEGLAWFLLLAWIPIKIKTLSPAYKNHDSPEAGGD